MDIAGIAQEVKDRNPVLFAGMVWHRTHRGIPIDFENYPYMRQVYRDDARISGMMKSTQSGISEYLLCRALALAEQGRNVFYVLPNDRLIGRFVRERFDKTVMYSPHYRGLIKESENQASNITMKQVGKGTIALVGSNSTTSFTEFPADDAIIDENDRCEQTNLLMVDDRLANSKYRTKYSVGQPTITDFGIHEKFKDSKQWVWHVKCPHCNKWFHPDFLKHVVVQEGEGVWTYLDREWEPELPRDPYFIHACGGAFDRKSDGQWIAKYPLKDSSYYHIGKEFSTQVTVRELCDSFSRGLDDDAAMMHFYNSDLGLPYTPKGSRITDADLDALVGDYVMPSMVAEPCVMGIDVGSKIHVIINQILPSGGERMVYCGWVKEKEDVIALLSHYNVICGVIDAEPEARLSRDVSMLRQFFRCYFHSDKSVDRADPATKIVSVNRTEILDALIAKVREKRWEFPRNAKSLPELYPHMKANTRVFNEDRGDAGLYEYVGTMPDHLMFAAAYATLARRIVGSVN